MCFRSFSFYCVKIWLRRLKLIGSWGKQKFGMRIYLFELKWRRMAMLRWNIFNVINYRTHFLSFRSHLNVILDLIFNWWMSHLRRSPIWCFLEIDFILRGSWSYLDHYIMNSRSELIIFWKAFRDLNVHLIGKSNWFLMHWRLSSTCCRQNTSHFDLLISWRFHFIL